jgi:hypothetical protein
MASIQDLGRQGCAGSACRAPERSSRAGCAWPMPCSAIRGCAGDRIPRPAAWWCARWNAGADRFAGHFSAELTGAGGRRRVDSWRSVTLAPARRCAAAALAAGRVGYLSRWPGSACRGSSAALRPMPAPASAASTAACWRRRAAVAAAGSGGEKMLRTPPAVEASADSGRPRAAGRLLRRAVDRHAS